MNNRLYSFVITIFSGLSFLFVLIGTSLCAGAMVNYNSLGPIDPDVFLHKGIEAVDSGKFFEGLPLLLTYIDLDKDNLTSEDMNNKAKAYFKAAYVYNIFNDYASSVEFNRKSAEYARKASNTTLEAQALCNQFAPLFQMKRYEEAKRVNEEFHKLGRDESARFGYTVNKGCLEHVSGNLEDAIKIMENSRKIILEDSLPIFFDAYPISVLADIFFEKKDYKTTHALLQEYKIAANQSNLLKKPELLRDCYKKYLQLFIVLKNIDSITHYQQRYFEVVDTLLDTNRFMGISGEFNRQVIDAKNREIVLANLTMEHQKWMLGGAVAIIIIIGCALFVIIREKRIVSAREKALFERNIELLKFQSIPIAENIKEAESDIPELNINNDSQGEIMKRILKAMQDESLWCDPDFSLHTLASIIGSNTKYVSQTVNGCLDKNFRNFVNEYRIRLACKRLKEKGEYLQYSVLALAESVGFRSSTSFTSAFQKQTGLSPAVFRKMCMTGENSRPRDES